MQCESCALLHHANEQQRHFAGHYILTLQEQAFYCYDYKLFHKEINTLVIILFHLFICLYFPLGGWVVIFDLIKITHIRKYI
jgi:hypothetical protein